VPRKGFAGQVRRWGYTDETPYVEAIKAAISNIDVTYIYNDEHDDFAELDRVSLAFEYPVRNPTNLGWMIELCSTSHGVHASISSGNGSRFAGGRHFKTFAM